MLNNKQNLLTRMYRKIFRVVDLSNYNYSELLYDGILKLMIYQDVYLNIKLTKKIEDKYVAYQLKAKVLDNTVLVNTIYVKDNGVLPYFEVYNFINRAIERADFTLNNKDNKINFLGSKYKFSFCEKIFKVKQPKKIF